MKRVIMSALLLVAVTVCGQMNGMPAWFASLPDEPDLLLGRGMADLKDGETKALAQARQAAMRDLAISLVCRVTAQVVDVQSEGAEDRFTNRTTVESALELVDVKVLQEAVTPQAAFVMVAVRRDAMTGAYRERVQRTLQAATGAFARGQTLETDDPHGALDAYAESLRAIREAEGALQVYLALHQQNDITCDGVPDANAVQTRLQRLAAMTPRSLTQIADMLALELTKGAPMPRTWYLQPVTFGNTDFVSEFGYALTSALKASLGTRTGVQVTENPARADVQVRSKMLREGQGVLLVLSAGNQIVQHFVEPLTCEKLGRETLVPSNLDRLLADKLALQKALVEQTGLRLELRTDRLDDGPVVYRYGEQPRLAVRVNQACTIRLIYVTADGQRLLLLDRYTIGEHQANQWVPLPLELEVCEPAGVEQLLAQAATDAQDERLPPLKVKNRDLGGGFFLPVIIEPLDEAMQRTRGVMKKSPGFFAEVGSDWTVFAK